MKKLLAGLGNVFRVFKAGEVVANPVAWKRGQITAGYIVTLLSTILIALKGFGYEFPTEISEEQLTAVATTVLLIYGMFNSAATVVSTDKIDAAGREDVHNVDSTARENLSATPASARESIAKGARYVVLSDSKRDKEPLQDSITDSMERDSKMG